MAEETVSNICKTGLRTVVQNAANSITSCNEAEDILLSAKSVQDALWKDRNSRITKISINNLPPASDFANGHVAYLEDGKIPVIASNGVWVTVDGRTINVNNENQLWAWGDAAGGELGDGTTVDKCSPVREISSSTNWCRVSVWGFQSAIKIDGTLWNWGFNTAGRLGDGTTLNRCSPVREASSSTNWCMNAAGNFTGSAIKTDGSLWSWGDQFFGELGDGTTTIKCSPVREASSSMNWCITSVGRNHAGAIKTDGSLWSWGTNNSGRLGDGNTVNQCSPVREFYSDTNWKTLSMGRFHSLAVKTTGTLWGWGFNADGQLGNGTFDTACSPVQEICSATNWCQVSSGRYHSAGVKTNGTIWSWGANGCGELGIGTASFVDITSPVQEFCRATNWCQVSAGSCASIALKTDGSIWGWGCNWFYALGDGTDISRCSPVREFSSSTDWCTLCLHFTGMAIKSIQTLCR